MSNAEDPGKFSGQMLGATFDYAKLALSSLILLSGAAATALLAFIGTHGGIGPAGWLALLCFAIGAWLGGVASVLAYFVQRLDWEIASGRRTRSRLITPLFTAACVSIVLGYVLFAVGSVTGGHALRVVGTPTQSVVAAPVQHAAPSLEGGCASGSLCFQLVQGIPAAIVALVIGFAGSLIALRQAAIAAAKLKLDLFEKRYPIFLETWTILSGVVMKGTREKNYGLGNPFSNFMPQARFLFGRDVEAYLSNAVTHWTELYAIEAESADPGERGRQAHRRSELTQWFHEQASTGVKEVFGRYLDFEKWR